MRNWLCLWLIAAIAPALSYAQLSVSRLDSTYDLAITDDPLYLREQPSQGSPSILLMPQGTHLDILETSLSSETIDGRTAFWYRVRRADGATGWCFGGYLLLYARSSWTSFRIELTSVQQIVRSADGGCQRRQTPGRRIVVVALPKEYQWQEATADGTSSVLVDSGGNKIAEIFAVQEYTGTTTPMECHSQFDEIMVQGSKAEGILPRLHTETRVWGNYEIRWNVDQVIPEGGPRRFVWYPNTYWILQGRTELGIFLYEGMPDTTVASLRAASPMANRNLFWMIAKSLVFAAVK